MLSSIQACLLLTLQIAIQAAPSWSAGLYTTKLTVNNKLTDISDAPAHLSFQTWTQSNKGVDNAANITFTNNATYQAPFHSQADYMYGCINLPEDYTDGTTYISEFTTSFDATVIAFVNSDCKLPSLDFHSHNQFCSTKVAAGISTSADCQDDVKSLNKQGSMPVPNGGPSNAYPTKSIAILGPTIDKMGWWQSNWKNIAKAEVTLAAVEVAVAVTVAALSVGPVIVM